MTRIIENINAHIADEQSKFVYQNRVMYSLTKDYSYILNIVKNSKEFQWLIERINQIEIFYGNEKIWIFGAGFWGNVTYDLLESLYNISGFIDNDFRKHVDTGGRVIRGFDSNNTDGIYVIATKYYKDIEEQLVTAGVPHECIISLGEIWRKSFTSNQYFDMDIMRRTDREIFIDCGCYDGADVDRFVMWSEDEYEKIIAFEPDNRFYEAKKNYLSKYRDVQVIQGAVGEYEGETKFTIDLIPGKSRVDSNGNIVTRLYTIDNILGGGVATFIKMDIEGGELSALRGAKKTIENYHPKLAICVYHKPEDMWEIPNYVLSLDTSYQLYFRHYNFSKSETVMFAI